MKKKNKIYIPKDLDNCFVELKKIIDSEDLEELNTTIEEDMVLHHHGLGRYLRNTWGLWQDSHLSKWFNEKDIHHADDMSGIILDSFWRHLHSQPVKLEEQIKHYQDYWENINANKT